MTDTSDLVSCAMCQQRFMSGAPGSTVRVVDHGEDHYCPLCWSGQTSGQTSGYGALWFFCKLTFLAILVYGIVATLADLYL